MEPVTKEKSNNNTFGSSRYHFKKIKKAILQQVATEDTGLALLVVLAVLLPPVAVLLKEGKINSRFWISLLLTLFFWLPGVIYTILVIFSPNK